MDSFHLKVACLCLTGYSTSAAAVVSMWLLFNNVKHDANLNHQIDGLLFIHAEPVCYYIDGK